METGELRKHGVRVRLQHRPFQILAALLESPGRLVTREELRNRLWSSDVFVDFESGLNTAVNRLRLALGDSAENPVYIETLSRLGYRFLVPVELVDEQPQRISAPAIVALPPPPESRPEPLESPLGLTPEPALPSPVAQRRFRILFPAAVAVLLLAVAAAIALRSNPHAVSFTRLTFRKGFVSGARFTSNGQNIVYTAEWNGPPSRLFSLATDRRETKDLNLSDVWLAGIASPTEFGLFVKQPNGNPPLLELGSPGAAPRRLAARAKTADWGPHGALALVTAIGSTNTIEYPPGHKLYRTLNWIDDLRVSPDGARLAFCEHPIAMDDAGQVTILNSTTGASRILSRGWGSLDGLAWNPSGSEVWFTASHSGVERSLWAVNLDGRTRLLAQTPGGLELRDVSPAGHALIARSNQHLSMLLGDLPHSSELDISWLDWSRAAAISAAGSAVLFDESGSGGGAAYSVFLHHRGSSTPERIGSGRAMDLSNDGRFALTQDAADPTKLTLISVATHSAQPIPASGFVYRWSKFFPDAREILSAGHYPGQPDGIYRQRLTEPPQLVNSNLQLDDAVIDPTGRFASGVSEKCEINILDLSNGHTRTIPVSKMAYPAVFLDAGHILTRTTANKSIELDILDTGTGQLRPFRRIDPVDSTGLAHTFPVQIARNLETYVYSRVYTYSDLFLVSGLS